MGVLLSARCPCGYCASNILLGAGMMTFNTRCSVPALCPQCGEVVTAELADLSPACPTCRGGVDVYSTTGDIGEAPAETWNFGGNPVSVPLDGQTCPRCHEESLVFVPEGAFD